MVVEVLCSTKGFWMVGVVVVVCLSVGLSGYHHQYLFCAESPERVDAVIVSGCSGRVLYLGVGDSAPSLRPPFR